MASDPTAIACMRTKNIQADLEDDDLVFIPKSPIKADKILRAGDILVSSANSWNLVGKCCWIPDLSYQATFGGFTSVLRVDPDRAFPRYVYHWFSTDRTQQLARSFGQQTTNIANLNQSRCLELEIPLPSLEEQRRVAAILDKADALRRKRRQALELVKHLKNSIFLEMFGDPASNPKGLPKISLGDLIRVKSGDGLVAKDMAPGGAFPVYGGNGINGYHDQFMFEEPKLVVGRVGVYCGAVHLTKPKSWVTDNALYVAEFKRPISETYLKHALIEANLNQYAGRAAQPLISGGRIYPVEILLPREEDQACFEKAIANLDHLGALSEIGLKFLDDLFSSLQHRAFSGQL
ncbi:restriction endonuclease subunit S [Bradyrhizobium diazoefficiens]|nr:restriction endonuclease subunit S [Bradyrhizobium diazoefficiens]